MGRPPKLPPVCPGAYRPASRLTGPGRGICSVCDQDRSVYDSSRHGRGLLTEHTARTPPARPPEPTTIGP